MPVPIYSEKEREAIRPVLKRRWRMVEP